MQTLQWRHIGHDIVSNHPPQDGLYRLFRRRTNETSKLRVTGFCIGNSAKTSEFPAQMASNAENFPFDEVIMITPIFTTMNISLLRITASLLHICSRNSPSWCLTLPATLLCVKRLLKLTSSKTSNPVLPGEYPITKRSVMQEWFPSYDVFVLWCRGTHADLHIHSNEDKIL